MSGRHGIAPRRIPPGEPFRARPRATNATLTAYALIARRRHGDEHLSRLRCVRGSRLRGSSRNFVICP
jgi:hypothetical protein